MQESGIQRGKDGTIKVLIDGHYDYTTHTTGTYPSLLAHYIGSSVTHANLGLCCVLLYAMPNSSEGVTEKLYTGEANWL